MTSLNNIPDNGDELGDDLKFYGLPEELQKPSLYYKSSSEKDTKVYLTNQVWSGSLFVFLL